MSAPVEWARVREGLAQLRWWRDSIDAKKTPGEVAHTDQVRAEWQRHLAERFGVDLSDEQTLYVLLVGHLVALRAIHEAHDKNLVDHEAFAAAVAIVTTNACMVTRFIPVTVT